MKSINKIVIMIFSLFLLNGCSSLMDNRSSNHFISKINLKDFKLNQSLSKDMISFIQNYYPNSKTTFYFKLDQSAYEQGEIIENALRNVGYGVSYIKKRNRIPFAYKIDFVADGIIRATYNIGSSTFSRLYKINGQNVQATTAFTTRGFKKALYKNSVKDSYQAETYPNYKKAIVTIPILRIRSQPSTKSKIIGKYHKDDLLYVEDSTINNRGEEWSRVIEKDTQGEDIYSENFVKYVSSKYLQYLN